MSSLVLWAKTVPNLTGAQRLVLCELALLADAEGVALASIKHLEQATGCARRSVYDAIRRLENQGVVQRERCFDATGRQRASKFYLCSSGTPVESRAGDLLRKRREVSREDSQAEQVKQEPLPAELASRIWVASSEKYA